MQRRRIYDRPSADARVELRQDSWRLTDDDSLLVSKLDNLPQHYWNFSRQYRHFPSKRESKSQKVVLVVFSMGVMVLSLLLFRNIVSVRFTRMHMLQTQSPTNNFPDILFIMTDQQRFDAIRRVQEELPWYKNMTKIKTPNLDFLSKQGVYFSNAYTQCAVCGPARASLRTGCTIERTGVQHNDMATSNSAKSGFSDATDDAYPKDSQETTMEDLFRDKIEALQGLDQILATKGGYRSEYYGKFHLPSSLWNGIVFNDYDFEAGDFEFCGEDLKMKVGRFLKYHSRKGDIPNEQKVTDMVQSSSSFGVNWQLDSWTRKPYRPMAMDARIHSPANTALSVDNGFHEYQLGQPNVCGEYYLASNYTTTAMIGVTAVRALRRLLHPSLSAKHNHNSIANNRAPFLLTVSFHNPHPPMIAASKYLKFYLENKDKLFVPPSIQDDRFNTDYLNIDIFEEKYRDPHLIREWTAVYYAMIEEIDDWIGQLLDTLYKMGKENNTMIIFTSDHGEMLGAHGMREKNNFFEESSHVPLFIVFPSRIASDTVVSNMVSHLDVFATILDYVGLSAFDNSDGKSLRSFVDGTWYNHDTKDDFVVGEWDFRKPVGLSQSADRPMDDRPCFMVRKGPWKLMIHKDANTTKMDMLYNLESDPFEMKNFLGLNSRQASLDVLSKAEHLRCLLLEWMERMDHERGYYTSPYANFGEGRGDWEEVRQRKSWPELDFWVSDEALEFGTLVSDSKMMKRSEYLYLGTRGEKHISIHSISISGTHGRYFRVDTSKTLVLQPKACFRIKITFSMHVVEYGGIDLTEMNATLSIQTSKHKHTLPLIIRFGITRTASSKL